MMVFLENVYCIIVVTWILYYLFKVFVDMPSLPWSNCEKGEDFMLKMNDLEGEIQGLAIQDELKPGGVFEDLPWEILKMVLENLPEREIKKTRRLSRWYEKRVTKLFPPIFCNFKIKFYINSNSTEIMATLDRAMLKPHNKGNTMKLQFDGKLTSIPEEMITRYQERIVALDIPICGGEDFLIQPSMNFNLLESLSVYLHGEDELTNRKNITESLIIKHASKLKKLRVSDGNRHIDDLNVPALPCLESLTVDRLNTEPAWSLFRASKQTITSLNIRDIDMNTQPRIKNANDNEVASIYQVPNLQNLLIYGVDSTKFLIHNATILVVLVALELGVVDIPSNLPELPQLRELNITYLRNHSLICSKCKGSLKCLVYNGRSLDDYAVTMPQLTDLYIKDSTPCGKFLSYNHESLEFIGLRGVRTNTITLDDGVKIERVKTVVLKSYYGFGNYEYTEEDRARMAELCPNAEILIWNKKNDDEMKEFVLSNHRRRGFTSNLKDFLENY